jgi:hypothetical protein
MDYIELALEQIVKDVEAGDLSAIEELLKFVPEKNLIAFLPEEITNA